MKLEEIIVPDPEAISGQTFGRLGGVVIVVILAAIVWSRPVLRYGVIGAAIFAGLLFVMKQGGGA